MSIDLVLHAPKTPARTASIKSMQFSMSGEAKAWLDLKKNELAEDKALKDACDAAADEWKTKLAGNAVVKDVVDRAENLGYADCLANMSGSMLVELLADCDKPDARDLCSNPQTCELVKKNLEHLDLMPRRYIAPIRAAAQRCGS